jgi:hypothetical protein
MSNSASLLRSCSLALVFLASCSPAELDISEDGPVLELTVEQPIAVFEVALCTKERSRGDAQISGAIVVEGLEAAAMETTARVRVSVDDPDLDPSEISGPIVDENWTDSIELDDAGPWDDEERGCGPAQRVTFELVGGEPTDAVVVFWRVSMGVTSWKNLKGKRRGWEERDLEIMIAPA